LPGEPGQVLINGRAPANPKAEQTLKPGDLVEVLLPGGGGYGSPAERDPALRQRDLQQGYVLATQGAAGH
jgi:N-methylhydantoinase B